MGLREQPAEGGTHIRRLTSSRTTVTWWVLIAIFVSVSLALVIPLPPVYATAGASSVDTSTSDGQLHQAGTSYQTVRNYSAGNVATSTTVFRVGQDNLTGTYRVWRSVVFFDTASLPDNAVVTSANLSLYCVGKHADTSFNITVQTGVTSAYPNDPLFAGDYSYTHYTGDGGSANVTAFTANAYNNITLNPTGLGWINVTSATRLVLRSNWDIGNIAPADHEFANFSARENGINYTVLHIAYVYSDTVYYFYGGYSEAGVLTYENLTINVFTADTVVSFTLNGSHTLALENPIIYFTWNLTTGTTNETRTYYVHATDGNEFYVYLPPDPYYPYLFEITDFYGITNGYVESVINVNGSSRVVERQPADVVNAILFYMGWANRYTMRLRCDQGTYSWGGFTALSDQTQILIVTVGMFPAGDVGLNVTVNAGRMNSTWIQANYTDNQSLTDWLNVTVKHRSGSSYVTDYSTNVTGQTQQVNWYSASATVGYLVDMTALRNGTQYTWSFACARPQSTTVWGGTLDALGTSPFDLSQLFGFVIVLCVFGAFSAKNIGVGCILGVLTAGIMIYIGFLNLGWGVVSFAFFLAVLVAYKYGKRREREL